MTITVNTAEVLGFLTKEQRAIAGKKLPKAVGRAAEYAKTLVKNRSQSGKGVRTGREYSFSPYSKKWSDFRSEKGRQTVHVDLNFSGRMWSGLRWKKQSKRHARIFFTQREAGKAVGNHEKRPFFLLSDVEERKILNYVSDQVRGWF